MINNTLTKTKYLKLQKYNEGFVALFSVLIASIVLTMALGIANVSLKQMVLAGSVSDATRSFYAADSGIECALFHDLREAQNSPFVLGGGAVNCAGNVSSVDQTLLPEVTEFMINFVNATDSSCAKVTVDKSEISTLGITTVTSRGTNYACDAVNSRTVERAIQITY